MRTRVARLFKGIQEVDIIQFAEVLQGSTWDNIVDIMRPAEELFVVFDTSRDGYIQEAELLDGLISLADSLTVERKKEEAKLKKDLFEVSDQSSAALSSS